MNKQKESNTISNERLHKRILHYNWLLREVQKQFFNKTNTSPMRIEELTAFKSYVRQKTP